MTIVVWGGGRCVMTILLWHLDVQHIFPLGLGFCWWQVPCTNNNVPSIHSLFSRVSLQIYAHSFLLNFQWDIPVWVDVTQDCFCEASPGVHFQEVRKMPYHLHFSFKNRVPCFIPTQPSVVRPFFALGVTSPYIWSSSSYHASTLTLYETRLQTEILF